MITKAIIDPTTIKRIEVEFQNFSCNADGDRMLVGIGANPQIELIVRGFDTLDPEVKIPTHYFRKKLLLGDSLSIKIQLEAANE